MWGLNGWGAILLVNCNPGDTDQTEEQPSVQEGPKGITHLMSSTSLKLWPPLDTHAGHTDFLGDD